MKIINLTQHPAVLIPSSSGQAFGPAGRRSPAYRRLTPFFVRASVRTRKEKEMNQKRLNPFFVRASVRTGTHSPGHRRPRRLNPFFVRASVRTRQALAEYLDRPVLIPSSSGQAFGPMRQRSTTRRNQVLIPSSSGQAFGLGRPRREHPALRLNPFFVRASVRTRRSRARPRRRPGS